MQTIKTRQCIFRRFAVATIIAVASGFGFAPAQAQDTVTISSGEWAPFTSENLPHFGIGPHIVTAAFAKAGLKAEYQWYPWTRAMKEAEDGNVDFTAIWVYNEDRGRRFNYSNPVVYSNSVFFYRTSEDFDWNGYDDFPRNTVVGTTRGYSYGQAFDDAANARKFDVDITRTDLLNFKKLMRGRIDLFPIDELVGYDILKNSFTATEVQRVIAHPRALSTEPMHLLRSKKHPQGSELLNQFNKGLQLLKSSGEYDKILDSYK